VNLTAHAAHEQIMLNSVEEFRQVNIDHMGVTLPDDSLYLLRGSVGGSAWAETKTRCGKSRIENRRQDL